MIEQLKPLLELLGGKAGWLTTLITWFGVLAPLTVLFATKFKHWASDKLNEIAASEDVDDDAYLTALFSAKWYRFTAFVLRFTPFHLPTLADLQRAIRLQNEAAGEASVTSTTSGSSIGGAVGLLALLLSIAGLMTACNTTVQVKEGADPIIVVAEWAAENALNSIDSFLAWERNNEAVLLKQSPAIHTAADALRDAAAGDIANLRSLTEQYKKDKSAANGEKVKAATDFVLGVANSVRAHQGLPPLVVPQISPNATDLMKSAPTNGPPAQ